jgi:plastocyanin/alpha-tubulin suppressor-like RCC1 family protein
VYGFGRRYQDRGGFANGVLDATDASVPEMTEFVVINEFVASKKLTIRRVWGASHATFFYCSDNKVYGVGYNNDGIFLNGNSTSHKHQTPAELVRLNDVLANGYEDIVRVSEQSEACAVLLRTTSGEEEWWGWGKSRHNTTLGWSGANDHYPHRLVNLEAKIATFADPTQYTLSRGMNAWSGYCVIDIVGQKLWGIGYYGHCGLSDYTGYTNFYSWTGSNYNGAMFLNCRMDTWGFTLVSVEEYNSTKYPYVKKSGASVSVESSDVQDSVSNFTALFDPKIGLNVSLTIDGTQTTGNTEYYVGASAQRLSATDVQLLLDNGDTAWMLSASVPNDETIQFDSLLIPLAYVSSSYKVDPRGLKSVHAFVYVKRGTQLAFETVSVELDTPSLEHVSVANAQFLAFGEKLRTTVVADQRLQGGDPVARFHVAAIKDDGAAAMSSSETVSVMRHLLKSEHAKTVQASASHWNGVRVGTADLSHMFAASKPAVDAVALESVTARVTVSNNTYANNSKTSTAVAPDDLPFHYHAEYDKTTTNFNVWTLDNGDKVWTLTDGAKCFDGDTNTDTAAMATMENTSTGHNAMVNGEEYTDIYTWWFYYEFSNETVVNALRVHNGAVDGAEFLREVAVWEPTKRYFRNLTKEVETPLSSATELLAFDEVTCGPQKPLLVAFRRQGTTMKLRELEFVNVTTPPLSSVSTQFTHLRVTSVLSDAVSASSVTENSIGQLMVNNMPAPTVVSGPSNADDIMALGTKFVDSAATTAVHFEYSRGLPSEGSVTIAGASIASSWYGAQLEVSIDGVSWVPMLNVTNLTSSESRTVPFALLPNSIDLTSSSIAASARVIAIAETVGGRMLAAVPHVPPKADDESADALQIHSSTIAPVVQQIVRLSLKDGAVSFSAELAASADAAFTQYAIAATSDLSMDAVAELQNGGFASDQIVASGTLLRGEQLKLSDVPLPKVRDAANKNAASSGAATIRLVAVLTDSFGNVVSAEDVMGPAYNAPWATFDNFKISSEIPVATDEIELVGEFGEVISWIFNTVPSDDEEAKAMSHARFVSEHYKSDEYRIVDPSNTLQLGTTSFTSEGYLDGDWVGSNRSSGMSLANAPFPLMNSAQDFTVFLHMNFVFKSSHGQWYFAIGDCFPTQFGQNALVLNTTTGLPLTWEYNPSNVGVSGVSMAAPGSWTSGVDQQHAVVYESATSTFKFYFKLSDEASVSVITKQQDLFSSSDAFSFILNRELDLRNDHHWKKLLFFDSALGDAQVRGLFDNESAQSFGGGSSSLLCNMDMRLSTETAGVSIASYKAILVDAVPAAFALPDGELRWQSPYPSVATPARALQGDFDALTVSALVQTVPSAEQVVATQSDQFHLKVRADATVEMRYTRQLESGALETNVLETTDAVAAGARLTATASGARAGLYFDHEQVASVTHVAAAGGGASGGVWHPNQTSYQIEKMMSSGYNNGGQMAVGHASQTTFANAVRLDDLLTANPGMRILDVKGGGHHTVFVTKIGSDPCKIYAVGSNGNLELGDGTSTNRYHLVESTTLNTYVTDNNTDIVQVECGWNATVALLANGQIIGVGTNSKNGMCDGTTTMANTTPRVATQVDAHCEANKVKVQAIAYAGYNMIVYFDDNTVYSNYYNSNGIFGNGSTTSTAANYLQFLPMQALNTKLADEGFTIEYMQGQYDSLLLKLKKKDGTFEWWGAGANYQGWLGLGHASVANTLQRGVRYEELFYTGYSGNQPITDYVMGHGGFYGGMVIVDKTNRKVWSWGYFDHMAQISNDRTTPYDRTSQWVNAIGEANVFEYTTNIAYTGRGVLFGYMLEGNRAEVFNPKPLGGAGSISRIVLAPSTAPVQLTATADILETRMYEGDVGEEGVVLLSRRVSPDLLSLVDTLHPDAPVPQTVERGVVSTVPLAFSTFFATENSNAKRPIANDTVYTAIVKVTDTAGTTSVATSAFSAEDPTISLRALEIETVEAEYTEGGSGGGAGLFTSTEFTKGMSSGYNNEWQMGNGDQSQNNFRNTQRLDALLDANPGMKAVRVQGGGHHTMLLVETAEGVLKLYGIGHNTHAEIGASNASHQSSFIESTQFNQYATDNNTAIKMVAVGWHFTSVLYENGDIRSLGQGHVNQLLNGNTANPQTTLKEPTLITAHMTSTGVKPVAIFAISYSLVVHFDDNTFYTGGHNSNGVLTNGNTTNQSYSQLYPITQLNAKMAEGYTLEMFETRMNSWHVKLRNSSTGEFEWYGVGNNNSNHMMVSGAQTNMVRLTALENFMNGFTGDHVNGHGMDYGKMVVIDKVARKVWSWGYYDHVGQISNDKSAVPVDRTSQWVGAIGEANVFNATQVAFNGHGVWFMYVEDGYTPQTWFAGAGTGAGVKVSSTVKGSPDAPSTLYTLLTTDQSVGADTIRADVRSGSASLPLFKVYVSPNEGSVTMDAVMRRVHTTDGAVVNINDVNAFYAHSYLAGPNDSEAYKKADTQILMNGTTDASAPYVYIRNVRYDHDTEELYADASVFSSQASIKECKMIPFLTRNAGDIPADAVGYAISNATSLNGPSSGYLHIDTNTGVRATTEWTLPTTESFSYSGWFKVGRGLSGQNGYLFFRHTLGSYIISNPYNTGSFILRTYNGLNNSATSPNIGLIDRSLNTDTWYHIVRSYKTEDGGSTYTVAIYVNGVPMNFANNNTGTLQQLIDSSNEPHNGSSGKYLMETNIDNNRFTQQTADTHVEMFLSNFAVWNTRALTPTEVATLYAEGFMGSASNAVLQSADHLFPFNEDLLDKGPSQLAMNAVYRDAAGDVVNAPETDGRMEFVKPAVTAANAPFTITFAMKSSVILPKTLEVGLFYSANNGPWSTWDVYAFEDNTEIYNIENGAKTTLRTTLSRYQSYSMSTTVNEGIVSSSPLAYKYPSNETKQMHHLHVRGKVFVSHTRGYTDQVIIMTLHPNTTIKYQTDTQKAQVTEVIADAYTQFIFSATSTSVSWPWTIEADQDVCVTNGDGNFSDVYVVFPASREIFGTVPGAAQVYAWDSANPTTAPTSHAIQAQASWTTTATSKTMNAHGFTNPFSAHQAHTGGFTRCYLEESVPSTIYISGIQYGDGDGGCVSCYIPREYLSTKILTSTSQASTTLGNVLCGVQFESGLPSTFDKSTVSYSTSGAGSVSSTASTNFNAANTQQDGVTLMHYNLGTNISNQLYESSNTYMFVLVNHADNEEVLLGNTPLLSNGAGGDPTPSPLVLGDTLTLRAFVTDANDAVSFNDRYHTMVDYQTVVSATLDSSGDVSVLIENTTATKTTVIASDKPLPMDRVLNLMKLAPSAEEEGALVEAKSGSAILTRCMLSDLSPGEAISKPISTFTDFVIYVLSSDESLTKILTENAAYEIQSIVMSAATPALSAPDVVNATSGDLRVKIGGVSTMFSSNPVPTTNVYSYDVSVANMQYVLSSASETTRAPSLEGPLRFFVGDGVIFNLVDTPNHPLYFTTDLNAPMNGMGSAAAVTNNGAVSGSIAVEFLEAGTFYYQCSNHSQMYRTIEVVTSVDVSDNELYVFAMRLAPDVPLTRKRSVTVASGQYMVNNAPNAEIVMYIGDTLELNADVSGHPLWIKSVGSIGTSDTVDEVENNGAVSGIVRWKPTYHGVYYYNCQFHGSMRGVIRVLERVLRSNFTTDALYVSALKLLEHAPTHTNSVHADVLYKQAVVDSGERIEHVFSDLSFGSALGDYNGYPIPIQSGDKLAIVCMGVQDAGARIQYSYATSPVYFDLSEFSPTTVTKSEFSVSETMTEFTYTFGANSTVIQFQNDLQFDTYYDFDIVPSGSGSGSSHPYMMSFSIFATQGDCGGREADGVNTAETPKSGKYVGGNAIHYYHTTTGTLTVFGVNAGNNLTYDAEYMSLHHVRVIASEDTFTVLLFEDEKRTTLKQFGNLSIPPSSRKDYSNTLNSQSPYRLAFGFRENGTTNFSGNKISIRNLRRHN